MLNKSLLLLLPLLCPFALAQGTFAGPGVLSAGPTSIGQRSGQDVDLKFFVNATGIYDTGLTPYAVTKEGTLLNPGALVGMEAGLGTYGKHTFRKSSIGLDYSGNFRHYTNASNYDGSNQQLNLGYTYQRSRRLIFNFNESAGTQSYGTAIGASAGQTDPVVSSSSILFDNRTSYLQTALNANYAVSNRTIVTMGGNYYTIHRQSSALVGVNGYALSGAIKHRITRNAYIGATYQHSHYDFPRAFGEADINSYAADWSTIFGRSVSVALSGGIFTTDVQGVQNTALDPSIAALLGIGSVQTAFFTKNILPIVNASIVKRFRRSSLNAGFSRNATNGNGVYLTSRQESVNAGYSFTGFRKWSISIVGGRSKLASLGQNLVPYTQYNASGSLTYRIGSGFNLAAGYNRRYQDINAFTFQRDSSRVTFGIYWSPGQIPVSFH